MRKKGRHPFEIRLLIKSMISFFLQKIFEKLGEWLSPKEPQKTWQNLLFVGRFLKSQYSEENSRAQMLSHYNLQSKQRNYFVKKSLKWWREFSNKRFLSKIPTKNLNSEWKLIPKTKRKTKRKEKKETIKKVEK